MIINWLGYSFFKKKTWDDANFCFFYENMLGKYLGFDRMHEKKIFFVFFLSFEKEN